jgi:hypothetical protein
MTTYPTSIVIDQSEIRMWEFTMQSGGDYFNYLQITENLGHERTLPPDTAYCCWCSDHHDIADGIIAVIPRDNTNYRHRGNGVGERGNLADHEFVERDMAIWLCDSCQYDSTYCEDCNNLIHTDNTVNINYAYSVCDDCCNDNYYYCDDHDTYVRNGSDCDDCDEGNCDGLISDYSYRPSPIFILDNTFTTAFREPANRSFTGFELEMEAVSCDRYEGAELAHSLYGNSCYLKHDGSLNDGFEMVSHPLSRDYIDSGFKYDGLKQLASLGMRSAQTRTCGLHVHINRGFFAGRETSLYRFMAMFYNNGDQWRTLSGRQSSTYARWNDEEAQRMFAYTRGAKNERVMGRSYGDVNDERYVAINLMPRHTIELRFFKGTLRPLTLKARLEAVHAVAEYSISTRNNINIKASSDWDRFRQFAQTNGYNAFSEYATEKGV